MALQRFLAMVDRPQDRRLAYQNLGACYLALERYDEALAVRAILELGRSG